MVFAAHCANIAPSSSSSTPHTAYLILKIFVYLICVNCRTCSLLLGALTAHIYRQIVSSIYTSSDAIIYFAKYIHDLFKHAYIVKETRR